MRLALAPLLLVLTFMFAGGTAAMDKENTLYIDLKDGRVVIEMRPDLAPNHVKQIKKLAREGKYDGVLFHRVIDGFMAQTGDPTGTGTGGSSLPDLPAEFTKKAKFVRGTQRPVGLAQKFARHENRVGLPGVDDVFGLRGRGDHADRAGENSSFFADALRKRYLVTRAYGNFRVRHTSAGRAVDKIHAKLFQFAGERDRLFQIPPAFYPIGR